MFSLSNLGIAKRHVRNKQSTPRHADISDPAWGWTEARMSVFNCSIPRTKILAISDLG